jgi:flagellar biogenesis protein FliO
MPISPALRLRAASACALAVALLAAVCTWTATPAYAASKAAPATKTPASAPAKPAPSTTKASTPALKATDKFEQGSLGPGFRNAEHQSKGSSKKPASSSGSAGRMLVGLVLVLALIYGIHWLLKKYGQSKNGGKLPGGGVAGDAIEVMATTALAAGRTLHLVRVGKEVVLIGATEQSITQLQVIDTAQLATSAAVRGNSEFHQALQGALTGQPTASSTTDDDTFMKRFVNNLQLMTSR